jgi:hypothetical protein
MFIIIFQFFDKMGSEEPKMKPGASAGTSGAMQRSLHDSCASHAPILGDKVTSPPNAMAAKKVLVPKDFGRLKKRRSLSEMS